MRPPACRAHRFTAYQTTLAVTRASCRNPLFNTGLNTFTSLNADCRSQPLRSPLLHGGTPDYDRSLDGWPGIKPAARLVTGSRLVFTKNDCVPGFRLSPKCSPICYGLVIPRGRFIWVMNDKGRYHSPKTTVGRKTMRQCLPPSAPATGRAEAMD